MCGIAAIIVGKRARRRVPYPVLRNLARELMSNLEIRGIDAAGIAVINQGGSDRGAVYKMPIRASRLIARPKFNETLERITEHTNFVLLHARSTTVGSNENHVDNHPIVADHIVGIHNGTLVNHDKLEKELSIPRTGEVDSEIIFRLFQRFVDSGDTQQAAICKTTELLEGAFTGAAVDRRYPDKLTMFKHERPLVLVRLAFYDIVIAVSEVRIYEWAAKKLNLQVKDEVFNMSEDHGFIFDVGNGDGSATPGNVKQFKLPVKKSFSSAGYIIDKRGVRALVC